LQAKRDVHYVSGPPPGVCDAQELHWVIRSSTDLQVFRSSGYIAFRSSGSDRVRFPPETYSLAVRCSSTARSLLTDYSSFPTWPIAPSRCGQILATGGRSADSSVLWKVVNVRRVPSSRPPSSPVRGPKLRRRMPVFRPSSRNADLYRCGLPKGWPNARDQVPLLPLEAFKVCETSCRLTTLCLRLYSLRLRCRANQYRARWCATR